VGQTWLACAVGPQACRDGWTTLSLRLPRRLHDLLLAKGDGRYPKLMTTRAKTALLLLDDWGVAALRDANRRDLLERLEDRHERRATSVTRPLPVEHWHEALGDPTLADALLDRLVHHASKIAWPGDSLRKRSAKGAPHAAAEEARDAWIVLLRRAPSRGAGRGAAGRSWRTPKRRCPQWAVVRKK
jgi:DNA replication protein DnaC